jgi:hypothetical protein
MRIATFKAKCKKITCRHVFDAPLLSDFSYGEFIYGSIDSKLIRYYCGLDCETWSFIDKVVSEKFSEKNRLEIGAIIQKIIGFVADRQETKIYFTQDIYCPNCQTKVKSIDVNNKTGLEEYNSLTFNDFSKLTEFAKKEMIDRFLNEINK